MIKVSIKQKFPLQMKGWHFALSHFMLFFIILVLKTAQLLLHDIPVLLCIDAASLPFLISRFH